MALTKRRISKRDRGSQETNGRSPKVPENKRSASSAFAGGIRTSTDIIGCMGAVISDLITGAMSPGVANGIVNATGKMLKVVEMQYRYGASPKPLASRTIDLNRV